MTHKWNTLFTERKQEWSRIEHISRKSRGQPLKLKLIFLRSIPIVTSIFRHFFRTSPLGGEAALDLAASSCGTSDIFL